jgi:hypothetical protein
MWRKTGDTEVKKAERSERGTATRVTLSRTGYKISIVRCCERQMSRMSYDCSMRRLWLFIRGCLPVRGRAGRTDDGTQNQTIRWCSDDILRAWARSGVLTKPSNGGEGDATGAGSSARAGEGVWTCRLRENG